MCEATTIIASAGLISGIAGTAVQYSSQRQAAKSQQAYNAQMEAFTRENAQKSLALSYADSLRQDVEESMRTSQELQIVARQSLEASETARAASMEAGVGGNLLSGIVDQYTRQQSMYITAAQMQRRASMAQRAREQLGMQAQTEARIAGSIAAPVQGPSALAAGIQAASWATQWLSQPATREGFGIPGRGPRTVQQSTAWQPIGVRPQ
jgi:hypothetical protein